MDPTDKTNYRFAGVLRLLSKVFKKIVYEQLNEYLNNYLNELLCGFCKAHSAQHDLCRLMQSWKKRARQFSFRWKITYGPFK